MSVAKSYAGALLGAVIDSGAASATLDAVERDLALIETTIQGSKELRAALETPLTSSKEKSAIIAALVAKLGLGDWASRFAVLIGDKGRVDALSEMCVALRSARLSAEGAIEGDIHVADPISAADVDGLAAAFGKKLNKKVVFRIVVDPTLLAGMKVTLQGVTYDGTLRSQIDRLRETLVHARAGVV